MCKHENIYDRICDQCGLITTPLQMSNGWWSLQKLPNKTTTSSIQKLILKGNLDIPANLEQIINCKQKQKRISFFPILLKQYNLDPQELQKKLRLTEKECLKGFKKTKINYKFTWVDYLKLKLTQNKKKFSTFYEILLNSESKDKMAIQIKNLINKYS